MTTIAARIMLWLLNRLCAKHAMRPQLWHATPGPKMQMCLEIVDRRTGVPFGRLYLHPDLMREFFELGVAGVDEYVAKCRKLERERSDE